MSKSDCFPSRNVLASIAAPMVNQSDLPFRKLVRGYDATLVYTQMLLPERLLDDQEYLDFHLRGLGGPEDRPVVVQLCGNDPETVVKAARKMQVHCDAIDLNLGCPQEAARDAHYGAYLLGQKDWPLVESIVSSMSHSLIVPVSAKLRLCQPASATLDLAQRLENVGASWITLHARTVSARRRRQGAADLEQVKRLKENLTTPVVSNGNVRLWKDVEANRAVTGADGMMVGETLLGNPCLFANVLPDPVDISREYLDLCREDPGTATIETVRTHVRHFIDHQCSRRPWFNKFRAELTQCESLDDIEYTLRKVQRWRGFSPSAADPAAEAEECEEEHEKTLDDVLDAIALLRN
ncbi:FMN-linked oxidoreductase [Laetiporus sulphureus 93-53]|uniref:tRNA-dihydrouridine(16/17) synthase [NAD(P)(+)] n=1 Tax=Laetiporus sulphureus 93-53 TaxID=1314785 RepID=A0A165BH95_9APHY|nr:FMN-linked oxidoreductase [Laetiporus sulphureus 93-53]KZT01053.1 FMN-linked oxidoreductase [Laetiporus sulphureus 93-53]